MEVINKPYFINAKQRNKLEEEKEMRKLFESLSNKKLPDGGIKLPKKIKNKRKSKPVEL